MLGVVPHAFLPLSLARPPKTLDPFEPVGLLQDPMTLVLTRGWDGMAAPGSFLPAQEDSGGLNSLDRPFLSDWPSGAGL